jgi:hypothetical protein
LLPHPKIGPWIFGGEIAPPLIVAFFRLPPRNVEAFFETFAFGFFVVTFFVFAMSPPPLSKLEHGSVGV